MPKSKTREFIIYERTICSKCDGSGISHEWARNKPESFLAETQYIEVNCPKCNATGFELRPVPLIDALREFLIVHPLLSTQGAPMEVAQVEHDEENIILEPPNDEDLDA